MVIEMSVGEEKISYTFIKRRLLDVLKLVRSRGGHISVKLPQLSYGKCIRWDIGCVLYIV